MTPTDLTPNVYISIVNWNGWLDTLECLESVFRLNWGRYSVVVCDNHSQDGSIEKICSWAEGRVSATVANPELATWTQPPVEKPVAYQVLDSADVGATVSGGNPPPLTIVSAGHNLGFAGANNLVLRYVLKQSDFDYVWLLNNDTVVHPEALSALVRRMQTGERIGMCGSKLLFYSRPHLVQAYGGASYNPFSGRPRHLGEFSAASAQEDAGAVEHRMRYVIGASMLISREFLERIGLMNEEYFLYAEELDWATRARGKFSLAYAPASIVYHKQGASIGSGSVSEEKLAFGDYYSVRSLVRFTRNYYPFYLPFVVVTVAGRLFKRLLRGQLLRSKAVSRGFVSAFTSAREYCERPIKLPKAL